MDQLLGGRHEILVAEDTVQVRLQVVGTQCKGLGVPHLTGSEQSQLFHEDRVMIGGHVERVQHEVSAHLIGLRTAHIDG